MTKLLCQSFITSTILATTLIFLGCNEPKQVVSSATESAANAVYVPPGELDEYYAFFSGGFSGQLSVYGLPSGRLLRVIPVFSQNPESAYGYSEETKPMLETSFGFVPWDDAHHPQLSQTDGAPDGRWVFINGNNTPRIARIDLTTFSTEEIIEIPHTAGNHGSPFLTANTEYVVSSTRFSVPTPQEDMSIDDYKGKFKGTISYVSVDPDNGHMELAFQILVPGFHYDLSHSGKGVSHGWSFFTTYNTEEANTLLEINASQNDKDYIAAVNWRRAEECVAANKAKEIPASYRHNIMDENTHSATSTTLTSSLMLDPADCKEMIYFLPTPKSPHGVDVDPSGEYIIGNGKLAAVIPVMSFTKMLKAIENKDFAGEAYGIPVLRYDAVLEAEIKDVGLGPLHTEFDNKGYGYTSAFITSEVVKWKIGEWKVVDRMPVYYSIGHLMIPGGDSMKPTGKYLVALNKITKDRYLPVGPELPHAAQLIDISGDKMKMLLDFPTIGEPHYAQSIHRDLVMEKSKKIYPLEENTHPAVVKSEKDARVERKGSDVHVYLSTARTHFAPDNIEGIKIGDTVYFHVTNLEQDWDVPHGFAVTGANNSELLVMPGETRTLAWKPTKVGVFPFYCTDFCSALHQEMQGYIRVSPAESDTPISFSLNEKSAKTPPPPGTVDKEEQKE